MPTYEYHCRACGERLEIVQAFTDDALTTCPKCGQGLRKIFGNVGIVLKGSGFYKTDNRPAAKSSTTAAADQATSTPSESKSGASESSSSGDNPTGSSTEKKTSEPTPAAQGSASVANAS